MYCQNCGEMIEPGCNFCPNCGRQIEGGEFKNPPEFIGIGSLFNDFEREFKKLEEMFKNIGIEEGIRADDDILGPRAHGKKSGGISIRISSGTGKDPKIDVAAFGDHGDSGDYKKRPLPKVIEEPEAVVSRVGGRITLKIKVGGVKSLEDVDIKMLQESIEIRAYAGDKAYFTLFAVPKDNQIIEKKLEKGELIIEMGSGKELTSA